MQLFLEELLNRREFYISVVSFHYPYTGKSYSWKGAKIIALGGNNKKGIQRVNLLRRALKVSKQLNKERKVDFIHSFWLGECTWVGNRLTKVLGVPHSCTLMGQDATQENKYLRKLRKLPRLITLSAFHQEVLYKTVGIKSDYVIPWGIEKLKPGQKVKKVDIIGVGWLNEVKSFSRFIYVIKLLKEFIPAVKAEIIGEGKKREQLEQFILAEGLSDNVTLVGGLNRQETLNKIEEAHCLLHCSNYESFGMVIIEALAMGTKVFSTPVGIAPELKEVTTYRMNDEVVKQITAFLSKKEEQSRSVPLTIKSTVDSYLNSVF